MRWTLALPLLAAACSSPSPMPSTPSSEPLAIDVAPASSSPPVIAAPANIRTAPAPGDPHLDTSKLTPREQADLWESMADLSAPCANTPVSIAQCVNEKRSCTACVPAARLLMKLVTQGKSKTEREASYRARFGAEGLKKLSLEGSPSLGPADAIETIVVWADFQCPFCAMFDPIVEGTAKAFPTQVRVVFKFYPLSQHARGEAAARAAIAAHRQGKYLEMAHLLYQNQEKLEDRDLDGYARQLGLDAKRFKADMRSKSTTEAIAADKKQADALGLQGTPFLFFNGREVDPSSFDATGQDVADWVTMDIELAGATPMRATTRDVP